MTYYREEEFYAVVNKHGYIETGGGPNPCIFKHHSDAETSLERLRRLAELHQEQFKENSIAVKLFSEAEWKIKRVRIEVINA